MQGLILGQQGGTSGAGGRGSRATATLTLFTSHTLSVESGTSFLNSVACYFLPLLPGEGLAQFLLFIPHLNHLNLTHTKPALHGSFDV